MSGMEFSDADLRPGEALSGKTEWEDALIKHGIIQAKVAEKTDDDLHEEQVERQKGEDRHANKSMEQLDELEDELEDQVLEQYRARRMAMLKAEQQRNIYGSLIQLREQEYVQEVSQAPKETYVIVHLFSNTEAECHQLNKLLGGLAAAHRYVKICVIRAQEAIHNFPNHKCPTLLVYYEGNIIKQIEKLGVFGGPRASVASLEWVLAQPFTVRPKGAEEDQTHRIVRSQLTSNPLDKANTINVHKKRATKGYSSEDEDSD